MSSPRDFSRQGALPRRQRDGAYCLTAVKLLLAGKSVPVVDVDVEFTMPVKIDDSEHAPQGLPMNRRSVSPFTVPMTVSMTPTPPTLVDVPLTRPVTLCPSAKVIGTVDPGSVPTQVPVVFTVGAVVIA